MNETGTCPNVRASIPGSVQRRALVVDDNRDNAESLALLLRMQGDDVRTAHDGIAALEIGERFRPQIVLLDIGMPKMNGYETCREMRERAWGRDAIVIAQTGWGEPEDHARAMQAGFDAQLVKPIEFTALTELLATIDGRLRERDAEAS
ncbi:MAG: response regulator [Burkholderiaceae bacterium]|nr:response regulator [Burkholderiaceae bacterium]